MKIQGKQLLALALIVLVQAVATTTPTVTKSIYMQAGDVRTVQIADIATQNLKWDPSLAQVLAKYTVSTPKARISSVVSQNTIQQLPGKVACTSTNLYSGSIELKGASQALLLACSGSSSVIDYTVQQDGSLAYKTSYTVPTTQKVASFTTFANKNVTAVAALDKNSLYIHFYQNFGQKVVRTATRPNAFLEGRVFTDGFQDGNNFFVFAYTRALGHGSSLSTSSSLVFADWQKTVSNSFDLSQVIKGLAGILNINTQPGQLFVSYLDSANKVAASLCAMKFNGGQLQLTCQQVTLPAPFKAGRLRLTKDGKTGYFYASDANLNKGNIHKCDFSAKQLTFSNCVSTYVNANSGLIVDPGMNQVIDRIQFSDAGATPSFVFYSKASFAQANLNQGLNSITLVYGVRLSQDPKNKYLIFDQINNGRGSVYALASNKGNAFVFTAQPAGANAVYQAYTNNPANAYLVLQGSVVGAKSVNITVTQTKGATVTHGVLEVNVLKTALDGAAILTPLPAVQTFNGTQNRMVFGIGRSRVVGNDLTFSVSDPKSFDVLSIQESNSDLSGLKDFVKFTTPTDGITWTSDLTIYYFSCHAQYTYQARKCQINKNLMYKIEAGHNLAFVGHSNFPPQYGVLLATSDGKSTTFVFLGAVFNEVNVKKLQQSFTQIHFKITGNLFVFWGFNQQGGLTTINLYAAFDKELRAMPNIAFAQLNSKYFNDKNFCPVTILPNPLTQTRADVLSQCKNGPRRIYSVGTDVYENLKVSQVLEIDNLAFQANQQICNVGTEIFAYGGSTGSKVFAIEVANQFAYSVIDPTEIGYSKVTAYHCLPGVQSLIVEGVKNGAQSFSVLRGAGNTIDARNRWLGSTKIPNQQIEEVVTSPEELLVVLKSTNKANTQKAYIQVLLNSPVLRINPTSEKNGAFNLSLNIAQKSNNVATAPISFNSAVYNGTVSVTNTNNATSSVKGIYELFSLAKINGPVLSAAISEPGKKMLMDTGSGATLTPRVIADPAYQSQKAIMTNMIEPDRIHNHGFYSIGVTTSNISTFFYFYNKTDQFHQILDSYYLTKDYDLAFQDTDYFVAALSTEEGSFSDIRVFIKTWGVYKPRISHVDENISTRDIAIGRISDGLFAIGAVEEVTNRAHFYTVKIALNNTSGQYDIINSTITKVATVENVDKISSFDNDDTTCFVYTLQDQTNMNAIIINEENGVQKIGDFSGELKYRTTWLECTAVNGVPSCLANTDNNLIQDIQLIYRGQEGVVNVASRNFYEYYETSVPEICSYNEEYLVCRFSSVDDQIYMLFYQRGVPGTSKPWWSLNSHQYYNINNTKNVASVPLVLKDATGATVFRFTQNQLQGYNGIMGPQEIFKAYKPSPSLLVLSANVTKDQAAKTSVVFNENTPYQTNVSINQFFSKNPPVGPETGGGGNNLFLWIIAILLVILIILAITSIVLRKKNSEILDYDDSYVQQRNTSNTIKTKTETASLAADGMSSTVFTKPESVLKDDDE